GDHLSRRQHPTCRARLACERSEAVLSSTRARAVSKTAMAPAGSDVAAVAASDVEERVGDLTEAGHAYGLHQDREQVVASEGGVGESLEDLGSFVGVAFGEGGEAIQLALLLGVGRASQGQWCCFVLGRLGTDERVDPDDRVRAIVFAGLIEQ